MFSREELENMTLRQLRLIDIREVEDEKLVQELINAKVAGSPLRQDLFRGETPDFKNPQEEAEFQRKIDEKAAKRRASQLGNSLQTGDTQVDSGAHTPGDDVSNTTPVENTSDENLVDHELTQEDLDENPELKEQGLKAGDLVKIPKVEDEGKPVEDDPDANQDGDQTGFCAECNSKRKGKHKKSCSLFVE